MDSKTIDFINYHAASYVNEFMSGDSTTRARMQEILTSFGKQLIDCLPREGKESQHESGNCIKPDVNVRFLFDMGIKYVNELAEETGQKLHDDTARMVAKDYTKHVAHFLKNAR